MNATTAARPASATSLRALRIAAFAAVALLLVLGVLGGLQRAGALPWLGATQPAALAHGVLMIGGWLGSVIAIERAVALCTPLARVVPVLSVAAGLALAAGAPAVAAPLLALAATLFVAVHVQLWRRHPELHHAVMALGALAWCVASLAWWADGAPTSPRSAAAWFAFLVLTIAAERLELTRLTRRGAAAQRLFAALAGALLVASAAASTGWPAAEAAFGAPLVALAIWLARHDIARFTVRQPGLPRFIAVALWCGYAWLALAGLAWALAALGGATRDAALHALGVGFVLSMVMAHAPVILPAVTGVRVSWAPLLYLPLLALQASVAVRLLADLRAGALLHAAALLLFAAAMLLRVRAAARRP